MSVAQSVRLQADEYSIPARRLVPFLARLPFDELEVSRLRDRMLRWNYVLSEDAIEATVFTAWLRHLTQAYKTKLVNKASLKVAPTPALTRVIEWTQRPLRVFPTEPEKERDEILSTSFESAIEELRNTLGDDLTRWRYGQEAVHHIRMRHPLSTAVDGDTRAMLDVGPLPRGGDLNTVNNTWNNVNQTVGASFRMVADVGDWDQTVGVNSPGQSGDPGSNHYADLFGTWAEGETVPIAFSDDRVAAVAESVLVLTPNP